MRRTEASIDLAAISGNVERLRAGTGAEVMAVVKADGYGHGLIPSARAALAGGATWLGTAYAEEALQLRAAGVTAPILSWLAVPGEELATVVAADIDLSAAAPWGLAEIVAAARATGRTARVHLKVDTGLGRSGATVADWPDLVTAAAKQAAEGTVEVVGIWSHFAYADVPDHPTIGRQVEVFRRALEVAEGFGVVPRLRHLANSAATLTLPEAHFDLVRPGIAVYGLSPVPPEQFGLVPAMTLRSHVALAKRVPAGTGVSYGHEYVTDRETGLALVPLGYADGVPRNGTNVAPVWLAGARRRVAGRVCMDQFMLDTGDDEVSAGDEVLLFGPGSSGEPTAQEWAEALGTISYEIVTRVGARVPRGYPANDR
ncbi:MAG: alanine racemase [Actinobacteria bacterium]|nr:alanine racemase [Actinomycetota bacterium]MBI3686791.1 alanine racemase [Actinomycetota bacterium]